MPIYHHSVDEIEDNYEEIEELMKPAKGEENIIKTWDTTGTELLCGTQ